VEASVFVSVPAPPTAQCKSRRSAKARPARRLVLWPPHARRVQGRLGGGWRAGSWAHDADAGCSSTSNHIGRASAAGKRDDKVWPPLVDHLLVSDWTGSAAVCNPASWKHLPWYFVGDRPMTSQFIGSSRASFYNHRQPRRFEARHNLIDALSVSVIPAAADQDSHGLLPGEIGSPRTRSRND
jgi:hypothetical protein